MSEEHDDKKFYGKYRGTVLQNIDPEQRGRLIDTRHQRGIRLREGR